jgi:phosphatidylglycerophosphatase A
VSQTPATTANSAPRKPRFALAIATAFGLGYLPLAPGTWGSLAAIPIVYAGLFPFPHGIDLYFLDVYIVRAAPFLVGSSIAITLILAALGVWASASAARFTGRKDPQFVVIDEVSGQHLTYLLAAILPIRRAAAQMLTPGSYSGLTSLHSVLSWKFLLAGFILFRVFDIWKPFPARQAESLPGGWGIMADDWIAAIYAALGLWALRAAGL